MKKITLLMLLVLIASCVGEDYFGYSSYGNIKSVSLSNQASNAQINNDSLQVIVEIPSGVDLSTIVLTELVLSSFASADTAIGDTLNLETPQFIVITAEDGTKYNWKIKSFIATANPQLDNYDLNQWYKTSADYFEPGIDATSTIWGTGNPGTQILNKLATTPLDLGSSNLAAKMETLDNGKLAGTFGAPISAGSIFTGVFNSDNIDPTNPQAAIEFGTPFIGRPVKVKFKYAYQPGNENKNKDGDLLDYSDACDVYALLEVRSGGKIERLATAWFRNEEVQNELTTKELEFTYGALDDSFPDYMKPIEGRYVSKDSASFVLPTHVTFVGSSSYDGANFAGAIGSLLIIDDVEFVYE
ncbi:PCMD domain-containing protein [Algibacter mikhailovii]|uniref:Putative carbohydrate metabolism domain-containing protein n=1 Tax=Algibacter mikhailovii TaxID=425498 RepID=A0A918R3Y0_9FLAO|nr:PCMD domain-containing protein [Algibacter mikhailovii]GGZ84209.1 hypothetical protein GCM10007028_22570 [Algibacter mikhailovii]